MKKSDFIILVDMDDVLENLQEAWIKKLNEIFEKNVDWTKVTNWSVELYYPSLTRKQVLSPLFEDNFWNTVKPKEDAIKILKKLHEENYSIYIVTSSDYATLSNKFSQALWPYFPFIDENHIIVTNCKQLIRGHVLIDDGVHNLLDTPFKPTYHKILFTANTNKNYNTFATDITRVSNWYEIYSIIEGLFEIENELEKMSTKQIEID